MKTFFIATLGGFIPKKGHIVTLPEYPDLHFFAHREKDTQRSGYYWIITEKTTGRSMSQGANTLKMAVSDLVFVLKNTNAVSRLKEYLPMHYENYGFAPEALI